MADEIIGSVGVEITGDYSPLEQALKAAQEQATLSGEQIAAAFEQAGNATDLAGGSLALFTSALEGLHSQGVGVGEALESIAGSANTLGKDVADAAQAILDQYTPAVQEAATASHDAATGLDEVGAAAHQASESAHEAEGGFAELGAELLKMGGIVAGLEGLKELATESLGAYANIQKATIALSAMTGSAIQATEAIEGLRQLALSNALSFDSLVTAQQRMVAFGIDIEQIPMALQAAADAAAATNKDFDTVVNSIDRMVLSGNAGARQLASLGISAQVLANAVNVSAADLKNAFKEMDPTERLQAIETALQKFQGVGQQVAEGISGQWQNLKTQAEFTFEEIGATIAPAAAAIMAFANNAVIPSVNLVVSAFKEQSEAGTILISDLSRLGSSFLPAISGTEGLADSIKSQLVPGMELLTAGMKTLSLAIESYTNSSKSADEMSKLMVTNLHNLSAAAVLGGQQFTDAWNMSKILAGLQGITPEIKKIVDTQQSANEKLEAAKNAFDALSESYRTGTPLANGYQATAQDVARAQVAVEQATKSADVAVKAHKDSIEALTKAMQDAQTKFDNWASIYTSLLAKQRDGVDVTNQLSEAYKKLGESGKAAGQFFIDVNGEIAKLTASATEGVTKLTTFTEVAKTLSDQGLKSVQDLESFNKAMKDVASLADAAGISVTHLGNTNFFAVKDPAGPAAASIQALVDNLNKLSGAGDIQTVTINSKLVPTMQSMNDAASQASDGVSRLVTTVDGATVKMTNFTDSQQRLADAASQTSAAVIAQNKAFGDLPPAIETDIEDIQSYVEGVLEAMTQLDNFNNLSPSIISDLGDQAAGWSAVAQAAYDASDAIQQAAIAEEQASTAGGASGGGGKKGASLLELGAATLSFAFSPNAESSTGPGIGSSNINQAIALANATGSVVTTPEGTFYPKGQSPAELALAAEEQALKSHTAAVTANAAAITSHTAAVVSTTADQAKVASYYAQLAQDQITAIAISDQLTSHTSNLGAAMQAASTAIVGATTTISSATTVAALAINTVAAAEGMVLPTAASAAATGLGSIAGYGGAYLGGSNDFVSRNASLYAPSQQSHPLNMPITVSGNQVIGDSSIRQLADMIQQSTIATLRRAGYKL